MFVVQSVRSQLASSLSSHTGLPATDILRLFETPPQPELGDISLPCFQLAKALKKAPAQIASELASQPFPAFVQKAVAAGPYLNIFFNFPTLSPDILSESQKSGYARAPAQKSRVMVEFFGGNTHKAFHIGHLRNISFAESLNRLLEAAGHRVIRVNYQGDIGPHVAKALWGFLHFKVKPPVGPKGRFLSQLYAAAHKAAEEDPKIKEEIDDINRKLYAGDPKLLKVWKQTRQWSLDDYDQFYKEFGVRFDRLYFESEVEKPGTALTRQLLKQGVLRLSEGAIIADLEKFNLAKVVFLTGRQTPTYAAKDLGLALMEDKEFHPDRIIHVLGAEQTMYFQQIIKILELSFPQIAKKQFHLAYSLVTLPTGKMSSREGNVVLYEDLIKELLSQAEKVTKEKNPKLPPARRKKIAKAVAFAALRYPMVQVSPEKQIVYNPQAAVSLEGNTAPYLQYTHARACSILKKVRSLPPLSAPKELAPTEKALLSQLLSFPSVIEAAARDLRPHYLADFIFSLAVQFNHFYQELPVLKAPKALRPFRLHLVRSVQSVLKQALYLLGIEAPEEM